MAFIRERIIKGRPYVYLEERWREGKKVRSRSRILRKKRGHSTLAIGETFGNVPLIPALPFMIAKEVLTGKRLEELREHLRNPPGERHTFRIVHDPRRVVSEKEWDARVSQMSRQEFDRYLAHAKSHIASGKYASNTDAMKAARTTHAQSIDARHKGWQENGGPRPVFTKDDEELSEPDMARESPDGS